MYMYIHVYVCSVYIYIYVLPPHCECKNLFQSDSQIKFLGPYLEVSRFRRLAQRSEGAKLPRTRKLKEDLRGVVDSQLQLDSKIDLQI